MTIDTDVLSAERNLALNLTQSQEEEIVRLFLRSKDEHDDHNQSIASHAVRGFNTIERGEYGIPLEVMAELNLWGQIALLAGIGMVNHSNKKDLGRLLFGQLIKTLTESAYISGSKNYAANALFEMKKKKLGYDGKKTGSVADRMNSIDEDAKLQFLRSLYLPETAKRSFPGRGSYQALLRPGIIRPEAVRQEYSERERAIREVLRLLKDKEPKPYEISPDGTFRQGGIVAAESKQGKMEYFVQRNRIHILGLTTEYTDVYHCTCPSGWSSLISATSKSMAKKPCKHIQKYN